MLVERQPEYMKSMESILDRTNKADTRQAEKIVVATVCDLLAIGVYKDIIGPGGDRVPARKRKTTVARLMNHLSYPKKYGTPVLNKAFSRNPLRDYSPVTMAKFDEKFLQRYPTVFPALTHISKAFVFTMKDIKRRTMQQMDKQQATEMVELLWKLLAIGTYSNIEGHDEKIVSQADRKDDIQWFIDHFIPNYGGPHREAKKRLK